MTSQEEYDRRMQVIREHWPELAQQDRWANGGGFEMDLTSAWMYAQRDGTTFERYIIEVLRAERIRRQEQDGLVQDRAMIDDMIGKARERGIPVLEYVATEYGDHDGDTRKLARDFTEKIVRRLEERAAEVTEG